MSLLVTIVSDNSVSVSENRQDAGYFNVNDNGYRAANREHWRGLMARLTALPLAAATLLAFVVILILVIG